MLQSKLLNLMEQSGFKDALNESIETADNPYIRFNSTYKEILFDDKRVVNVPPPIISIDESSIATNGNIISILGQAKAGKSAVISGIIAGMINKNPINVDTLGFKVTPNTDNKAVIHFDTEQSFHDWHRSQKNILTRAKTPSKPDFYNSVYLRNYDIAKRIEIIKETCKVMSQEFNGIHAIFIDGIADLVHSVNDEKESYEIIDSLMKLSNQYKTIIVIIIHLNPGSLEKARGHLGSQLIRKSESVLSVTKGKESDISRVKPSDFRNAGAFDTPTIEFIWDKEKKQHSFVGFNYADYNKEQTKKEVGIETIQEILDENPPLSFTKLKTLIVEISGVSESTAKRAIKDATDKGLILKTEKGKYILPIEEDESEKDKEDESLPF